MNRTLVELYLKEWMTGDFFGQIIVLNSVKATKVFSVSSKDLVIYIPLCHPGA